MSSTNPPGLNLIERAVKRLSVGALKAEPLMEGLDPASVPSLSSAQISDHQDAAVGRLNASGQGSSVHLHATRPSIAVHTNAQSSKEVTLNFARLRQDQINTPVSPVMATQDEFRAIKRKLLLAARDDKSEALSRNVVMITSALPGEGKTFTALNLAMSLATERNLQVLLIDADVVRTSLQDFFGGNDDQRGLSDLLNGSVQEVNDVIHRCAEIPNLGIIFAGKHDARCPELMASSRMADIVSELSKRYPNRMIIIDSPPAIVSSEPAALALHVHQIILVVAAQQVSRHHVEDALERISACRNISLIFNKSPQWRKAHASYYYYSKTKDAESVA